MVTSIKKIHALFILLALLKNQRRIETVNTRETNNFHREIKHLKKYPVNTKGEDKLIVLVMNKKTRHNFEEKIYTRVFHTTLFAGTKNIQKRKTNCAVTSRSREMLVAY